MKRLLIILAFLGFAGVAEAQVCPGLTGQTTAYATEAITVSSTAIGFTAATYNDGTHVPLFAQVTLETNPIRVLTTGKPPTSSVGELWTNSTNVKFTVCGQSSINKFLAIRTGAADAAITVVYYSN